MSTELDPVYGPSRLAGRRSEEEGDWRYAGQQLGINLNAYEGMSGAGLEDLRRIRGDKYIPKSFSGMMEVRPELSEPGYSASGGYQPEIAYGA
jgi:hypothetical protein